MVAFLMRSIVDSFLSFQSPKSGQVLQLIDIHPSFCTYWLRWQVSDASACRSAHGMGDAVGLQRVEFQHEQAPEVLRNPLDYGICIGCYLLRTFNGQLHHMTSFGSSIWVWGFRGIVVRTSDDLLTSGGLSDYL